MAWTRSRKAWMALGGVVVVAIAVGLIGHAIIVSVPGSPPPPLTNAGLLDATRVCTGPGVEYDAKYGQIAAIAVDKGDTVRGEIIPERRSHRISKSDLKYGRVIARLRLVSAGRYPLLGLTDTMPACWFVQGVYPDSLFSTIYGFDGRILAPRHRIRATLHLHIFHARAQWNPVEAKHSANQLVVIAAAQGTCTKGGCCPQ